RGPGPGGGFSQPDPRAAAVDPGLSGMKQRASSHRRECYSADAVTPAPARRAPRVMMGAGTEGGAPAGGTAPGTDAFAASRGSAIHGMPMFAAGGTTAADGSSLSGG